jgi:hypothetical protein
MNLLAKIGIWGLLAAGTASALYADPAGGWLSPNGVSGGASGSVTGSVTGSATGSVTGSAGVTVTLSLADLQTRVHQLHDQTRADARHIQHLQQVARKEKDIIKLNCVNDKLVQVKPMLNMLDEQTLDVEATGEGERGMVFEKITGAAEGIHRLREEADQCIGEPVTTGGESSNSFTGPTAPDDPTKGFASKEIEPPGYASPFN